MVLRRAVVTGASSGIGEATVRLLRERGWEVLGVARRAERLAALAEETGAEVFAADLTSAADVAALRERVEAWGPITTLVNNAGGAKGTDRVEDGDAEDWRWMYEINVIALQQVTAALLPSLRAGAREAGHADVLNLTSTAAHFPYAGGGGYNAAKFAARAVTNVLRLELSGEPIRVVEVAPGMVHTEEFSLTRFGGDQAKADAVYQDIDGPLAAEDIAEAIVHAVELPGHVSNDLLIVKPVAQSAVHLVHRGPLRVRD